MLIRRTRLSTMLVDGPVDRRRLSDIAFARLRQAIVTGALAPGIKLKDAELADQLGLSRTPVREALGRLADAGLVEAKPGVHTRVTTLNRPDVEATLAVLEALDHLAVTSAVPRLTADDVKSMKRAHRDFAAAVRRKDVATALRADGKYHGVILDAADNPVLSRLVEMIHPQVQRIVYRKFTNLIGSRETVEHHARLLQLCEAGDAEQAAAVSAEHWRQLGGLIAQLFESDELESTS